jgi:hypothetical protein
VNKGIAVASDKRAVTADASAMNGETTKAGKVRAYIFAKTVTT